jgi:hypothetical protein
MTQLNMDLSAKVIVLPNQHQWVTMNLPQFNGYFKSATMSLKEYPYDYQEKSI